MIFNRKTVKHIFLIGITTSLGACSIFEGGGDEIIFDTTLGPRTETQLKSLPSTLVGDDASANHTPVRKGKGMESSDGSDGPGGGKR